MEEIWKDIEGYEGLYQVSNTGKVLSIGLSKNRKNGELTQMKRRKNSEHLCVHLYDRNGKKTTMFVHQIVGNAFISNPDNLPNLCHKDDNPLNNHIDNLFWGTQDDNIKDRQAKGRQAKGESVNTNVLTKQQVESILVSYTGKRGQQLELGKKYGVHGSTIGRIVHKKTWKHI